MVSKYNPNLDYTKKAGSLEIRDLVDEQQEYSLFMEDRIKAGGLRNFLYKQKFKFITGAGSRNGPGYIRGNGKANSPHIHVYHTPDGKVKSIKITKGKKKGLHHNIFDAKKKNGKGGYMMTKEEARQLRTQAAENLVKAEETGAGVEEATVAVEAAEMIPEGMTLTEMLGEAALLFAAIVA